MSYVFSLLFILFAFIKFLIKRNQNLNDYQFCTIFLFLMLWLHINQVQWQEQKQGKRQSAPLKHLAEFSVLALTCHCTREVSVIKTLRPAHISQYYNTMYHVGSHEARLPNTLRPLFYENRWINKLILMNSCSVEPYILLTWIVYHWRSESKKINAIGLSA